MAIYAIGDVQGCYQPLQELLQHIGFRAGSDQLWFCGDLVNRGPDSLAVLRFLYQHRESCQCVLGNHDLHLLAIAHGTQTLHKHDTLQPVLSAPDADELLDFMRHWPMVLVDQQRKVMMSHAGLPPHWSIAQAQACAHEIEQVLRSDPHALFSHMYGNEPHLWRPDLHGVERLRYSINALTRMRYVDGHGGLDLKQKAAPGQQPATLLPWFASAHRQVHDYRVLFGHWASLNGICPVPGYEALDTGCVWGQYLTAYRIDDGQRFQVPGWREGQRFDE